MMSDDIMNPDLAEEIEEMIASGEFAQAIHILAWFLKDKNQ